MAKGTEFPDALAKSSCSVSVLAPRWSASSSLAFHDGLGLRQCMLSQNKPNREDGRRPLAKIAEQAEGFSGSDLLELCSRAAAVAVQEHLDRQTSST